MTKEDQVMELFDATMSALAKLMDSVDGCYQFVPSDCGLSEDEQFEEAILIWDNARVVLDKVKTWKRGLNNEYV